MVEALLDTSVVVDILRQYPPAKQWLLKQENLGVASIVWIEILQGSPDKNAQHRALKALRTFERINLNPKDIEWAIEQVTSFSLSHRIGGMDCLIASVNARLQIPLYTTNMKHFTPLLDTLAQRPY